MADHCDTQIIEDLSPSKSGNELKHRIEEDYPDTSPLEDAIVPDSDDESVYRAEGEYVMAGLSPRETESIVRRNKLELGKRQLTPGHLYRRGNIVSAHPCLASASVTSSLSDKESVAGPISMYAGSHNHKQIVVWDKGMSKVEDQTLVDTNLIEINQHHNSWESRGSEQRVGSLFAINASDGKSSFSSSCEGGSRENIMLYPCGPELARHSHIESQKPEGSSQADALDFVDRYLSVNNVNLSQEVETRNFNRIKPPPNLLAKASQTLAGRRNLRIIARQSATFDWADNQTGDEVDASNIRREQISSSKDRGPRSVTITQTVGDLNFQYHENLDLQGKEKLPGDVVNLNHSKSKLMPDNYCKVVTDDQLSDKKTSTNFVKELDEQLGEESSVQKLENGGTERGITDLFDVGFDTQMAAEAMEALLHVHSLDTSSIDAYRGLENTVENSIEVTAESKTSDCDVFTGMVAFNSENIARKSKRTKRPSRKLYENTSTSFRKQLQSSKEPDSAFKIRIEVRKEKLLTGKFSKSRNPTNTKQSLDGRYSSAIGQQKEAGSPEEEKNEDLDTNPSSSKSVQHDTVGQGHPRWKHRTFSPIAHQTRHCRPVKSLGKAQINSSGDVMSVVNDFDLVKRRRKRSRMEANVFPASVSSREKHPKLDSATSVEHTNCKSNQEGQIDKPSPCSHIGSDSWSFPKGKRTCYQRFPWLPKQVNDLSAPVTAVEEENSNVYFIRNHNKSEGTSKVAHFSRKVWGNAQTLVYTRRILSSSGKKCMESSSNQNLGEQVSGNVINYELLDMNAKMIVTNADRDKISLQSDKLVDMKPVVFAGGAKNSKDDVLSIEGAKAPVFMAGEDSKQPCKKNISRTPLMKELNRLGYAESLPNFIPKDLRRRKFMVNVRVLFSQNMDGYVIKQQKKILARLGFSFALCCSDATHFVTDRFARTRNMLEAIALGKPVVTHLWLESCREAGCFVDEKNYILRDANKEKEIGFSMPVSLVRAIQHPLLKDQKVLITPNVKPGKNLIGSLVKAVHGQVVENIHRDATMGEMIPDDLLIVSCEQDYAACVPFLEKGAAVYDSELLLNGIVIQKLEFQRHRLFVDHVKGNRLSFPHSTKPSATTTRNQKK